MNTIQNNEKLLKHIPYLDGWRGIAIICVLFAHFTSFGKWGGIGVNIFFVLSGVLMSRILFVEKMPLRTFYRRRAARILPVFWLYIIVISIGWWFFLDEFVLSEIASTSIFFRTYYPDTPIFQSYLPVGHIWSLNVEEHCYVILSMVSLLAIRSNEKTIRITLSICSALCILFFVFYKYYPPTSLSQFTQRSEVAAFPLLLSCAIFMWLQKYPIEAPAFVPLLSLAAAFFVAIFSTSVFSSFFLISIFLAISVNTLNSAPRWLLSILSNSIIRWLGICSFSIYLWQQVFYFCGRYAVNWDYYGVFAVASTLIVSSCSFYFFENPLRKWLSGVSRHQSDPNLQQDSLHFRTPRVSQLAPTCVCDARDSPNT